MTLSISYPHLATTPFLFFTLQQNFCKDVSLNSLFNSHQPDFVLQNTTGIALIKVPEDQLWREIQWPILRFILRVLNSTSQRWSPPPPWNALFNGLQRHLFLLIFLQLKWNAPTLWLSFTFPSFKYWIIFGLLFGPLFFFICSNLLMTLSSFISLNISICWRLTNLCLQPRPHSWRTVS